MEVRNLRLCDLDFDRKQLKVVQAKGKKDRFCHFRAFDSGLKKVYRSGKTRKLSLWNARGRKSALRLVAVSIPDIRNRAFNGR